MAVFEYTDMVQTQMPEFASSFLPSNQRPLASQIQNQETGATWADFFVARATENISDLVQLHMAAAAAGFVLPQEDRDNIELQYSQMLMEAQMYSNMSPHAYPTPMSYLQALYGSSLNENTLRGILDFIFTAFAFSDHMRESFTYSEAVLEAFYLDNMDKLDIFRYRIMQVELEQHRLQDFASPEEYEEAQDAAAVEMEETAQAIADSIITQEDFIDAAREYDEFLYSDERSTLRELMGETIDFNLVEWLVDESRSYGDITTIEVSSGTYVLFFVERDNNDYYTTAMRQILILRDEVDPFDFIEFEDDPDYIEALEIADEEARERAMGALAVFEYGGATESLLIEMMEDFSDDHTEGGFYDDIARFSYSSEGLRIMRVVEEIEDWLFDETREFGDHELVRTEAFGYHLLYFMGRGELFSHIIAADRMRSRDQAAWIESLPDVEVNRHWAFVLTQ